MMDLKNINHMPSMQEIRDNIGNDLFQQFYQWIDREYKALCKIEYSKDVWLRGWNIKFKKGGKSLCVIYPKKGYFTVLVVVGKKEKDKVEAVFSELSTEMQEIYEKTKEGNGQKWLMIDLKADDCVYRDTLKLIQIRRESK